MPLTGKIIEEQKNYYRVDTSTGCIRTTLKGTLKKNRKRVCVGDIVDVDLINSDTLEGIILKIHERKSYLQRPSVANLDQIFLITTFKEPMLDLEATDRFLMSAEANAITPIIVFNKNDLLGDKEHSAVDTIVAVYRQIGYTVIMSSAKSGEGIETLILQCKDKTSAFAGQSGVGKSTLLSRIFPAITFRIGEVSGNTGRGTHTTTSVSLLPLALGSYVADTPGFSFVDIPSVPEEEVAHYFPEFTRQIGTCRFNNCIHENEPGCTVRAMVEEGSIAGWRWEHYLKIWKEMRDRRREYRSRER